MWRVLSTLALAAALMSCARQGPAELTLEQVPEALRKAFATAKTSLMKKNAESIGALVTDKQYAAASLQLQALAANSDLTEEQRKVVAGATVVVNRTLQELVASIQPSGAGTAETGPAAAPPEKKEEAEAAAAVIQQYIRTK